MSGRIVGILLGAGRGERFRAASGDAAQDKLLQHLPDGRRVVEASAATLCEALDEVILVVSPGSPLQCCHFPPNLRRLESPASVAGMGHSVAAGVLASRDAAGWVVALADMPALRVETVAAVAYALRAGELLAAPECEGRRGHPVGFAAPLASELLALEGDEGARAVLKRHADRLQRIASTDPGIFQDVDTPADLKALSGA